MKAVIHINSAEHQKFHADVMRQGLERHGIACVYADYDEPAPCDFAVIWGWRQDKVISAGPPVLVMERGYVGDRLGKWTSLGWNGLNGRASFPLAQDGGARWRENFDGVMQPWKDGGNYILLMGQIPGDASLNGLNIEAWCQDAAIALGTAHDLPIAYRPHPLAVGRGYRIKDVAGTFRFSGSLESALEGAAMVATLNSNSGVDAVLAGVPTWACDEGAMAWPVTGHALGQEAPRPDRAAWAAQLAWCQWMAPEIASGKAWEALRTCLP